MEEKRIIDREAIVCFNVGGQKHQVIAKNFEQFPSSRLSKLIRYVKNILGKNSKSGEN